MNGPSDLHPLPMLCDDDVDPETLGSTAVPMGSRDLLQGDVLEQHNLHDNRGSEGKGRDRRQPRGSSLGGKDLKALEIAEDKFS
ncbi:unnamed protein product [Lota lota]